jgi:hypothetical protein
MTLTQLSKFQDRMMKICGINGRPIFCFALLVLVCVVLSPVPEKLPSGLQNKATYLSSA